nr:ankyrin repeat domain-containing protein [Azonexus sp. R2A61]
MIGAWEGNIALMRLFIARGADINQLNANGESALALAAWRGKMEAARWLVERGARINAPARRWSPLHYAVFAGNEEMMEYLIGLGADINARSTNGSTVLMMAVYEGREGLARKLIEKGADRSPKNDWGDGALEWAMRADNLNLARLVSNPEAFNIAVAKPKESWGEPSRSLRMSKELESLLEMRKVLADRGMSTDGIDRRIAAERVRIVRETLDRPGPQRASVIEVSADRQSGQQSVRVVPADKPAGGGFKVPPTNFHGQPKMPLKIPTKNY